MASSDADTNTGTDAVTPLERLMQVLHVKESSRQGTHSMLDGESLYFPTGQVYGGQVIAQSVMAACETVSPSRLQHSLHGYFIAPGDIGKPVHFDVETLRDGRSFSARRVNATQQQGTILTAIASFQEQGQDGFEFSDPMPDDVPDPEGLRSASELMRPYAAKSPFADFYARRSPFDIRHVTRSVLAGGTDEHAGEGMPGRQLVWMRTDGTVDAPQATHRAILALGCDQIMMEPVLRRAGLNVATPGISFASLDHSMWWYRDVDVSQWHLYVQDTPTAAHGRGLCQAKVYARDGRLVAAMVQEAMIRVHAGGSAGTASRRSAV